MDDQAGEGVERGRAVVQRGLVTADHQGQGPLLGPGRAARERGVEEAGAGGRDPLVLGPLHLRVDGRAVHHHWPGPERRQHGLDHLGHLGASWARRGTRRRPAAATAGRRSAVDAPRADTARVDRPGLREATVTWWPASRR